MADTEKKVDEAPKDPETNMVERAADETPRTVFLRGTGGAVQEYDLPLPVVISDQLRTGGLTRVNEDGSTYDGDEDIDDLLTEEPRTGVRADKVVVKGLGDVAGVRVVSGELVNLEPVTSAPPETRQVEGAVVATPSKGTDVVLNPEAAKGDAPEVDASSTPAPDPANAGAPGEVEVTKVGDPADVHDTASSRPTTATKKAAAKKTGK